MNLKEAVLEVNEVWPFLEGNDGLHEAHSGSLAIIILEKNGFDWSLQL